MKRIYLDHAATTPLCEAAKEAMQSWIGDGFGNPSSLHAEGRLARQAIDQAREQISESLGCLFAEVLFTSSGTEAAQMAVIGAALGNTNPDRKRILMSATEHHAVLETSALLQRLGFVVEHIKVDRQGAASLEDLEKQLGPDVLLVSVMSANNELGTKNDLAQVVALAKAQGALVHTDAVQSFLTDLPSVDDLGLDLLSVAGHKVNGPKGVGAVYIRGGTPIEAVTKGGGQEREMRAGTENVAAIAGFAAAVGWRMDNPQLIEQKRASRDAFLSELMNQNAPEWVLSSPPERCLPGHAHLRFPGVSAESMLILLDRMGVSASSGAACSSGSLMPSHVLKACGYSEQESKEGLRFTFGVETTLDEANNAAQILAEASRSILEKRRARA